MNMAYFPLGFAVGFCVFGVAMGNMALGIPMGVAFGFLWASMFSDRG